MFKPILTNDSVALIFEEPIDVPRIYTDDKKLSEILRNFISNALKFTQKGEVRVSARSEGIDSCEVFRRRYRYWHCQGTSERAV